MRPMGFNGGQLVNQINLVAKITDSFVGLGLVLHNKVLQFFDLLLCTIPDLFNLCLQLVLQGGREGRRKGGRVGLLH